MKLKELNSITACEKLKSLLEDALAEIKVKTYINMPEKSLPDFFIAIEPNGGMTDKGDIAEGIILINICVRLLKDLEINNIKMTRILEKIDEVIPFEGTHIDNYYFTPSIEYNYIDDMDYSLGFAIKSLNIFFRIERE